MNIITKPTNPEVTTAPKTACDKKPTLRDKIILRKWLFVAIGVHVVFALIATIWIISGGETPRKQFTAPGSTTGASKVKEQGERTISIRKKTSAMSAKDQAGRVTTNLPSAKIALPEALNMSSDSHEVFRNSPMGVGSPGIGVGPTGKPDGGVHGDGPSIMIFTQRIHAKSIVLLVDVRWTPFFGQR